MTNTYICTTSGPSFSYSYKIERVYSYSYNSNLKRIYATLKTEDGKTYAQWRNYINSKSPEWVQGLLDMEYEWAQEQENFTGSMDKFQKEFLNKKGYKNINDFIKFYADDTIAPIKRRFEKFYIYEYVLGEESYNINSLEQGVISSLDEICDLNKQDWSYYSFEFKEEIQKTGSSEKETIVFCNEYYPYYNRLIYNRYSNGYNTYFNIKYLSTEITNNSVTFKLEDFINIQPDNETMIFNYAIDKTNNTITIKNVPIDENTVKDCILKFNGESYKNGVNNRLDY